VSEAVKIANEITKWDGYALFDKDNVLLNDQLFTHYERAQKLLPVTRMVKPSSGELN